MAAVTQEVRVMSREKAALECSMLGVIGREHSLCWGGSVGGALPSGRRPGVAEGVLPAKRSPRGLSQGPVRDIDTQAWGRL